MITVLIKDLRRFLIITFLLILLFVLNTSWPLFSPLENTLFRKYLDGGGNIRLSTRTFQRVISYGNKILDLKNVQNFQVLLDDGTTANAYIINFYKSEEFDHAFGTATIFVDDKNEIVGFLDYYDFDPRPFGERSFASEIITRSITLFSPRKAKPFQITYGLQPITPIYDVVRDNSFSKIS